MSAADTSPVERLSLRMLNAIVRHNAAVTGKIPDPQNLGDEADMFAVAILTELAEAREATRAHIVAQLRAECRDEYGYSFAMSMAADFVADLDVTKVTP